jgi:hypothetical protein
MKIDFHEIEESKLISYLYFVNQVSSYDLREMNGFKVRNILSIAFNAKIQNLILEDLFNQNGDFLSIETKDNLFRYLSPDEKDDLKNLISNYLDYQIESSWYEHVCQALNESSLNTIVVSSAILNSDSILNELKVLFPKKKFADWRTLNEMTSALFLDYNQSWKKRNIFNVQQNESEGIFLKHFFENVYNRKVYNDEYQIYRSINTPLRKQLFGGEILDELKKNLDSIKPSDDYNEWDILHESDDRNYNNPQEEILIYFDENKFNKYRINESFILENEGCYFYKTAKDLIDNPGSFENKFQFSNIENIIRGIDLAELNKAVNNDNISALLIKPLWDKFELKEENGELWKQLLQKKVEQNLVEEIYKEIGKIAGIDNFVSIKTFRDVYCNPKSSTIIPLEKKVFKAICSFVNIPPESKYRLSLQRKRNLTGLKSMEFNRNLKNIICTIIEFKVLDSHKSDDKLLEVLNEVINKIEEKVDMDYFGFTRDSLLYVCFALCYEIEKKIRLKLLLKIEHITPN